LSERAVIENSSGATMINIFLDKDTDIEKLVYLIKQSVDNITDANIRIYEARSR